MKLKYKKELKTSNTLEEGDDIEIGGLLYTVTKVEDIFHYVPNARVRVSLNLVGATPKRSEAVLFLPNEVPIEILK